MDSPPASASPSTPPSRSRHLLASGGLVVALVLYGILLASRMGAYAGSSDASGYLNNARLLREGHLHVPQRAIEGMAPAEAPGFAYIPLGFTPVDHGLMVPTYPIGLSLLIVGVSAVTGWDAAPHVTMWLHAMLGVVLMYALARALGLSRAAAALGALLLGASPLYLFMSLQAMSDAPSLMWTTLAVYLAWRSRARPAWAVAAGAAVAIAVLIRPTNLLGLAPVGIALGFSGTRWRWLVLGGLPGAIVLAVVNWQLYGKVLTTGYGDVGSAFGVRFLPLVLANYARWLPVLLTPALVLVLGLPWLRRTEPRWVIWLLGTWILGFLGFYALYFHTSETWWYLRYLLPAFPACILGFLLVARTLASAGRPRAAGPALAVAALAVLGWDAYWGGRLAALEIGRTESAYLASSRWAQSHLPPRAVLACMQTSGALFHYTDFTLLRYDEVKDAASLARIERLCAAAGRPIYAVLFPFETKEALERHLPGRWTLMGTVRQVTIWRREAAPLAAVPARPPAFAVYAPPSALSYRAQ